LEYGAGGNEKGRRRRQEGSREAKYNASLCIGNGEDSSFPTMNGDHSSQRPASAAARMYDRSKGDHGGVRQSRTSRFFSAGSSALKFGRGRRPGGHTSRNLPCSTSLLLVLCLLVVLVTIYSSEVISFALRGKAFHLTDSLVISIFELVAVDFGQLFDQIGFFHFTSSIKQELRARAER